MEFYQLRELDFNYNGNYFRLFIFALWILKILVLDNVEVAIDRLIFEYVWTIFYESGTDEINLLAVKFYLGSRYFIFVSVK